jgi:phospholipase/carboxylesterase
METRALGPLRVRSVRSSDAAASRPTHENNGDKAPIICVLLHGFGAPGDDLVGLADGIDAPAATTFVFPEAPLSLAALAPRDIATYPGYGEPRAWWMIDIAAMELAISRGELRDRTRLVPEGLAEARAALSGMLDALAAESPGARIVLGGFSQGSMLALDLALNEPERSLTGVVVLSGTLLAEHVWRPRMSARAGLPVFQSHGRSDPILPFSIAETLQQALSAAGMKVTFDPFAGPHTILRQTLARLGRWLHELP